jgi:hypothetical protein
VKHYKVWIEIEEYDSKTDDYQNAPFAEPVDLEGRGIYPFSNGKRKLIPPQTNPNIVRNADGKKRQ